MACKRCDNLMEQNADLAGRLATAKCDLEHARLGFRAQRTDLADSSRQEVAEATRLRGMLEIEKRQHGVTRQALSDAHAHAADLRAALSREKRRTSLFE